ALHHLHPPGMPWGARLGTSSTGDARRVGSAPAVSALPGAALSLCQSVTRVERRTQAAQPVIGPPPLSPASLHHGDRRLSLPGSSPLVVSPRILPGMCTPVF